MKNKRPIVFVALIIIMLVISEFTRDKRNLKLKKDGKLTTAIYKKCFRDPQGGRLRLRYRIKVGDKYYDGNDIFEKDYIPIGGCAKVGNVTEKGYKLAVIYSNSNPNINKVLLKSSSFTYFNQIYTDSLNVLCEELGLEDCSNSNSNEAKPWWENFF